MTVAAVSVSVSLSLSPSAGTLLKTASAGACPLREEALVLVSYGGSGLVELNDGSRRPCKFKRSVGRPLCGDRVTVERADAESVVVAAITPRHNEFVRVGPHGRKQPIAANLDQVLIVVAPAPEPSRDLVERYLVAVHGLGLKPVLVLNKAELMDTAGLAEELQEVEIIHHLTLGEAPYIAGDMKGHFRLNDCFVGANPRDAVNEGRADYVPVHLHEMPRHRRRTGHRCPHLPHLQRPRQ